jgi:hypothetical protein
MKQIFISIENGDALDKDCDVLVLKYAQALYGVDGAAVTALEEAGVNTVPLLPETGSFRLIPSEGAFSPRRILFVGVSELRMFDYAGIRVFAARALSALAGASPSTRTLAMTLHGVGYGLDESEAFRAEVAGLLDAFESGDYPEILETITILERNRARATRLNSILNEIIPNGEIRLHEGLQKTRQSKLLEALTDVGEGSLKKKHIFTAMPFADEFEDRFIYGIKSSAERVGFLCERADLTSFVGDVIDFVRERINTASFVVADLTTSNPNVYLEVGYAWGRGVPTILLVSDESELKFDTRGQRCLVYKQSIKKLEDLLTKELTELS